MTGKFKLDDTIYRDGIPIEKGIVLTKDFLDINKPLITHYLDFWLRYPDLLT